jgi:hypothetical protein
MQRTFNFKIQGGTMLKKLSFVFLVVLVLGLLAGCAAPAEPQEAVAETEAAEAAAPAGDVALKVTGLVGTEMAWTEAEIKAMETMTVEAANKDGEMKSYDGVLINTLLTLAGPAADATTVVYVADDGFTGEVPLADVVACTNCIVSFRSQGGFSIIMPDFPGNVQVKGVVEIQLK